MDYCKNTSWTLDLLVGKTSLWARDEINSMWVHWRDLMSKAIHIRRCHICNGVSEIEKERVLRCQHCGQSLSPFYYFDDMYMNIQTENELRVLPPEGEYIPIYGLTAYWDSY